MPEPKINEANYVVNCSFCDEAAHTPYRAPFLAAKAFCSHSCATNYADNAFEQAKHLHQFATRWHMEEEANV